LGQEQSSFVMSDSSFKRDLIPDDVLMRVQRPARYFGNEWNAVHKDRDAVDLAVALVFPDTYEVGQSGLGLQILYHLINHRSDCLAERVFAPGMDLEAELRREGWPLWSLESGTPLSRFDLVGITLQYELTYTNILNVLELGGIPLRAADREPGHPLVIAGGPCAGNPEPLAPFLDAVVIGEGEEVIEEILDLLKAWKADCAREGRAGRESRHRLLVALAGISGVYVPSLYESDPAGPYLVRPVGDEAKLPICRRVVADLDRAFYPTRWVVPYVETVHDRVMLEIFRGCTRGCRFCQAGTIYRPVRERHPQHLLDLAAQSLRSTGHNELSLVSLSSTDYSGLIPLIRGLGTLLPRRPLSISLPSQRMDAFSLEVVGAISGGRRTSLTFAPEAGSQRIRDAINKGATADDLLATLEMAYGAGWRSAKLYFMIGLPGEEESDLLAQVDLVRGILARVPINLTLSVAPFVPKANTPFQWAAMESLPVLEERIDFLKRHLRHRKIKLHWHDLAMSRLEAILARGGRELGGVIEQAYRNGARFDGWGDHFRPAIWEQAFHQAGFDPDTVVGHARDKDQPMPWDHLHPGVSRNFMWREWERAGRGELTPDCRNGNCNACDICTFAQLANRSAGAAHPPPDAGGREAVKLPRFRPQPAVARIWLAFAKGRGVRFISHLDLLRALERACHRAGLPLAYSEGYHPRPRLSLASPLPLGLVGGCEWLELDLAEELAPEEVAAMLDRALPVDLKLIEVHRVPLAGMALARMVGLATYRVEVGWADGEMPRRDELEAAMARIMAQGSLIVERRGKTIDVRPWLEKLEVRESDAPKSDAHGYALIMALRTGPLGTARPDEVFSFMRRELPGLRAGLMERLGLFISRGSDWVSPPAVGKELESHVV